MVDIRQPPWYSFLVKLSKADAPPKIDLERIARLRRGGYTLNQIAEDQGVTRNAIWKRLQAMEPLPAIEVRADEGSLTIEQPGIDHRVLAVALARALNKLGYTATATHKNEEA